MAKRLLDGKIAIVTGSSTGIGLGTVQLLLSHGAKVAAVDIKKPPTSDSGPAQEIMHLKCDVSSNDQVVHAVDTVLKKFGRIDILINNAGVGDNITPTAEISDTTWRKVFAVNVDGPMHFIRACIPQFLKQDSRGCIVNVCSNSSVSGATAGGAYVASKHALLGLSRSTAWMYANERIRCSALCPGGLMDTQFGRSMGGFHERGRERSMAFIALIPNFMEVKDLMPSMLYLATAPGVNGTELVVDNGLTVA